MLNSFDQLYYPTIPRKTHLSARQKLQFKQALHFGEFPIPGIAFTENLLAIHTYACSRKMSDLSAQC